MKNIIKPDKSWTLFLDRDGVINKRLIDDYVISINQFEFIEKVPENIKKLSEVFGKIFIITNQQGIGKGLMSEENLTEIHEYMMDEINEAGGRIDKIYFCADLDNTGSIDRKPAPGMGLKAKHDFPDIDFNKSIMVGDTLSDMEFGKNLEMYTVLLSENIDYFRYLNCKKNMWDFNFPSLKEFTDWIIDT